MAFRIHDSVVRGEIDNRVKGKVRGRIWLEGRKRPMLLQLKGNACADLAGCRLTFANPKKRIIDSSLSSLAAVQRGSIGDLTASRKVRVHDEPVPESMELDEREEKPPEHVANCLYLEWFSDANGRVVLESTDYELTISAPEWTLTAAEAEERARQSAAGMEGFMHRLTENIERHKRGQKDPEEKWDEYDYEKLMKECDARTEKYLELLDKYGESAEGEGIINREMGWASDRTEEESEEENRRVAELNAADLECLNEPAFEPDPHREGIDWIRTEDGDLRHPLQHRCFESAVRFWKKTEELGLEESMDKNLADFICEFQTTGAKLAGALDGIARGEGHDEPGFTVACLKRALDHLHKSQAGLEAVAPKKLLPESLVLEARKELFEIREGILLLMKEYRDTV